MMHSPNVAGSCFTPSVACLYTIDPLMPWYCEDLDYSTRHDVSDTCEGVAGTGLWNPCWHFPWLVAVSASPVVSVQGEGKINARTARALFMSDLDYVLTETGDLALMLQCDLQEAGREAARYSDEHDD